MNPETQMYHRIKTWFEGGRRKAHYTRIENIVSSGVPDVVLCSEGKDCWIEAKVQAASRPHIRKTQHAWMYSHRLVGGIACVLIAEPTRYRVSIWHEVEVEPKDEKHVIIVNPPTFMFSNKVPTYDFIENHIWRMLFDWRQYKNETTG